MVRTLKEAEDRIRKAMLPPVAQAGQGFSPTIERLRQTVAKRKLPMSR